MSELLIQAFTYGSNQTRAEIVLRPVIPEEIRGKVVELTAWAKETIISMGLDLKHTDVWTCEICGEPARENKYDMVAWTHIAQPQVNLYIHHVCEAGNSPCSLILDRQSEHMTVLTGTRPNIAKHGKPDDVQFPLSASCLNCQEDRLAKAQLSRCGRCKLVRYVCILIREAKEYN
ncbi:hypothetical protein BDN70DRAFT_853413 [Pholiota conissans]|uniref:Uncharacterized protein n=1 Tax=Pholiota conissans TaxID=109636 RepID=A0A9P5Z689_9AGAR|nr:hypothetical protein BDN70DRAFT_853413 [Pholiota conissans]